MSHISDMHLFSFIFSITNRKPNRELNLVNWMINETNVIFQINGSMSTQKNIMNGGAKRCVP